MSAPSKSTSNSAAEETPAEKRRALLLAARPPISEILNLYDFEVLAREILPPKTWAYYSSAADDEIAIRENHHAFQRVWFRPRVLRDVATVDTSSSILGIPLRLPLFICPTGMAKMIHPDAEKALARAAKSCGIIEAVRTS